MKIGEMDMEGKYVVFKKEEWDSFCTEILEPHGETGIYVNDHPEWLSPITECMVIRYQDVFASTAFYNYAETIRTALDLMRILGVDHPSLAVLELTANRFAEAAADAQQYEGRKVPD